MSVHSLAKRFCRTRSSIYRIITEQRAGEIVAEPIDYMASPEFERPNADAVILGDATAGGAIESHDRKHPTAPKGLPVYLKTLYKTPLLTKDQEQALFRRFNYLKFKAARSARRSRRPGRRASKTLSRSRP